MATFTKEIELAAREIATHWIQEGTQSKGWYTCQKTGKKFRGADAAEQLKHQQESMAAIEQEWLETTESTQETPELAGDIEVPEQPTGTQESPEEAAGHPSPTMTIKLVDHVQERLAMGTGGIKLTDIKCIDCGATRTIKIQDAFQVKRCVGCQKKHRNKVRAEKRREKRIAEKVSQSE